MQKENPTRSDDDKMRLHHRKRNPKRKTSSLYSECPKEFEHTVIKLDNADKTVKTDDPVIVSGRLKPNGKTIIIDPISEKKRKATKLAERIILASIVFGVAIVALIVLLSRFFNSPDGYGVTVAFNKNDYITEDGNYIFGSFEGYVTIGDSIEKVDSILGLPAPGSDIQYFYGNSYLIIENDVVVGYHKDRSDYFPVTVGFKNTEINSTPEQGDSASRIVAKLGSPDTYLKQKWIYENFNSRFERNTYYNSDSADLIITFNDKYQMTGYEFVTR